MAGTAGDLRQKHYSVMADTLMKWWSAQVPEFSCIVAVGVLSVQNCCYC